MVPAPRTPVGFSLKYTPVESTASRTEYDPLRLNDGSKSAAVWLSGERTTPSSAQSWAKQPV
jgi:hypothetical protein